MLLQFLQIVIALGIIVVVLMLIDQYLPTVGRVIRFIIAAGIILGLLRLFHAFVCSWLCG